MVGTPCRRTQARRLCESAASAQRDAANGSVDYAEDLFRRVSVCKGPDRLLDIALRTGPCVSPSPELPNGVSLDVLEKNPHGLDLGALQPRLPEVLRTPSGRSDLAPEMLVSDVDRLRNRLSESTQRNRLARFGVARWTSTCSFEQLVDARRSSVGTCNVACTSLRRRTFSGDRW